MTPYTALIVTLTAAIGAIWLVVASVSTAWRWRPFAGFSVMSAGAVGYTLADIVATLPVAERWLVLQANASLAAAAVFVMGLSLYLAAREERALAPADRVVLGLLGVLVPGSFLPGVVTSGVVTYHRVAWLGVTWADAVPSSSGELVFTLVLLCLLTLIIQRGRRLLPDRFRSTESLREFAALGLVLVAGVNDSLVAAQAYSGPYVISFTLLVVAGTIGTAVIARFFSNSQRLVGLRSRLEEAVEARTGELVAATEALGQAEKFASIGQMSAGVAHEINSPTAAVLTNLQYLERELSTHDALPADTVEALSDTRAAILRVSAIVKQLQTAGRLAGGHEAARTPMKLATAARQAAVICRTQLSEAVEIQVDVPASLHALATPGLVEQVLVNLILNAGQAIASGKGSGCVRLRARERDGQVEIDVSDDGPGVRPDVVVHLFEPFFSTRPGHGTGLGLAISRGLARSQGGDLVLEETSATGTKMRLTLPVGDATPVLEDEAPTALAPLPTTRVLVVDDEPMVRTALQRTLRSRVSVECADGAASAMARIKHNAGDFDVVLCDVMMPDGGGPRFFRELSQLAPSLAGRTIFMTGGATTSDAQEFLARVTNPVLEKPVDAEAFLALVDRLVRAPPVEAAP